MQGREKEREREREKKKKKEKGQGRGEPTRGERKERRDRTQGCSARTCLDQALLSWRQAHRRREREPRPAPREERGEEETDPETTAPEARKRRGKNTWIRINKARQKRTPRTNEKAAITRHGARCAKPSGKTRRNKNSVKGVRNALERESTACGC